MSILQSRNWKKQLDNERCFRLWIELGSLEKVRQFLYDEGLKNKNSGQAFTIWGIRVAAFNWVLDNLLEAYNLMVGAGSQLTWEEFKVWAVWKSLNLNQSTTRMERFLRENDLYDPTGEKGYREIYIRKFPRIHSQRTTSVQEV